MRMKYIRNVLSSFLFLHLIFLHGTPIIEEDTLGTYGKMTPMPTQNAM